MRTGTAASTGATTPDARADAVLHVTLEPCCTHGRTPPCTQALAAAGAEVRLGRRLRGLGIEDGRLARLERVEATEMRVGERVEADEYGKDDARDFALWKGPKPGEPSWETEIGPGRPGWHIECSAMSMRFLGPSFDIHTGGVDLVFPHHTDEIAQSEAATGRTFVGYWLHNAFLQLGGQKMAKSTGNIERVPDIIGRGISGRALRLALISAHYRSSLTFGEESIAAATAPTGVASGTTTARSRSSTKS